MVKVKLVKQCLLEMYVLPNKDYLRMRFSRLFKSYRGEFLTVSDNINTDYTGITFRMAQMDWDLLANGWTRVGPRYRIAANTQIQRY